MAPWSRAVEGRRQSRAQLTGSGQAEARVAVGLPGRELERKRVAFHCQVASTSARQAAWSALAVESGL
jgi:hypothetical protein